MKNYLVYGTGKSGVCAAELLKRQKEKFIFFDENEFFDDRKFREDNPELSEASVVLKNVSLELIEETDKVIISPGVPLEHINVQAFKNAKKEIIGELELGFTYEKGSVIGITGTNGKTTTTALVGHIIESAGYKTYVAGNIGIPYTGVCDSTTTDSVTVLEVSSFQLETVKNFKPDVCAILNITPDHLDRHKTFENYCKIKKSIAYDLKEDGVCVLNYEDEVLREFGREVDRPVVFFSSKSRLDNGLYYDEGSIYLAAGNTHEKIIDVSELNILGEHNYENAMAAMAICLAIGVKMDAIKSAVKTFKAVAHRIEFVCEKNGVTYYNDSKGTNTDAAIKAINAMDRPIVLIGGGYDKKSDYSEWVQSFKDKVKHVVLIGESARDIAKTCEKYGFVNYSFEQTFEDAINYAINRAESGDCVLLSPACASWGMFKNYEERGERFKELVNG